MSDAVLIALIVLVGQMVTLYVTTREQRKTRNEVGVVKSDVADVKKHTNSLVTRAVEDAKIIGHGEGVAAERKDASDLAASRGTLPPKIT